jgi:hypothetical protein
MAWAMEFEVLHRIFAPADKSEITSDPKLV